MVHIRVLVGFILIYFLRPYVLFRYFTPLYIYDYSIFLIFVRFLDRNVNLRIFEDGAT